MNEPNLTCSDCVAGELVFNPQNVTEKNVVCRRYPPTVIVAAYTQQGAQVVSMYPQMPANTHACMKFLTDDMDDEDSTLITN